MDMYIPNDFQFCCNFSKLHLRLRMWVFWLQVIVLNFCLDTICYCNNNWFSSLLGGSVQLHIWKPFIVRFATLTCWLKIYKVFSITLLASSFRVGYVIVVGLGHMACVVLNKCTLSMLRGKRTPTLGPSIGWICRQGILCFILWVMMLWLLEIRNNITCELYLRWQQLWVVSCYHNRCLVMDELLHLITFWSIGWSPNSHFYVISNLSFLISWFTCFTSTTLWKIILKSKTFSLLLFNPITFVKGNL